MTILCISERKFRVELDVCAAMFRPRSPEVAITDVVVFEVAGLADCTRPGIRSVPVWSVEDSGSDQFFGEDVSEYGMVYCIDRRQCPDSWRWMGRRVRIRRRRAAAIKIRKRSFVAALICLLLGGVSSRFTWMEMLIISYRLSLEGWLRLFSAGFWCYDREVVILVAGSSSWCWCLCWLKSWFAEILRRLSSVGDLKEW